MQVYLIDIDGTLLLSGGAGFVALEQTFEELFGVRHAMRSVRPAGKTDPLIVQEGFGATLGRDPTAQEMEQILERYVQCLPDALVASARFQVLDGAREGLERLQREGHLLGLATGNVREAARLKLAHGELDGYFSFGGYGDDSADRATLVRLAADRAGEQLGREVTPDEVVVVGDTPRDVAAARASGFGAVAVASGTVDRDSLVACRPDRIVTRLDQL